MKIIMSMISAEKGLKKLISAMSIMGFGIDKVTSRGVIVTYKSTPIKFEFDWNQSVGTWLLLPKDYMKKITNPKKIHTQGAAPEYVYEIDFGVINSLYEKAQIRKKKLEDESKAAKFKSEILSTYIKGSITGKGISIIGGGFEETTRVRKSKLDLFYFTHITRGNEKFNDTDIDELPLEVVIGNTSPTKRYMKLKELISKWEDGSLQIIVKQISELEDSHKMNLSRSNTDESVEINEIRKKYVQHRKDLNVEFDAAIKKVFEDDKK